MGAGPVLGNSGESVELHVRKRSNECVLARSVEENGTYSLHRARRVLAPRSGLEVTPPNQKGLLGRRR